MKYHLGFLGGGQLARMSIQAAQRMGLRCVFLDPGSSPPASFMADQVRGELSDFESIEKVLSQAEFVTLENEFIPADAIFRALQHGKHSDDRIVPGVSSLAIVQDKLRQREALFSARVPSPRAVPIEGDGEDALRKLGLPLVLKTRFGGYDGKGTRYAKSREEWDELRPEWSKGGWLAEEFVPFRREVAVMVAIFGDQSYAFPTMESVQTDSVCDLVYPCDADGSSIAIQAVQAVGGTGLFGVELFQLESGELLVNELAPRPHNTGHYTLDWGGPSQFEYHIRSVLGMPMVKPRSDGFAVMANLLGQSGAGDYFPAVRSALETPNAFVHWYQKEEPKKGRKMGHLNVVGHPGDSVEEVVGQAVTARRRFYEAWIAR